MTELLLVRHAQASFTADDYDALSPIGIDQSRLLGRYFTAHGITFDAMISGTMLRHAQTLDVLAGEFTEGNAARRETHEGLNEYQFREMMRVFCEAYPRDDLVQSLQNEPHDRRRYFQLLRRVLTSWSEDRLDNVPETWSEFRARVLDARAYLQALGDRCRRLLVVSSGGAISAFTGSILDLAPRHVFDLNLQVRNTSVTRFFLGAKGFLLAEFNTLPHLTEPGHADFVTYS